MIQSTPTTSLVPPAVSAVPAPPIQTAHAPSRPAYSATRVCQLPVQHYFPQKPFAPVRPPDDHNAAGVLEMAIASSFGIPKLGLNDISLLYLYLDMNIQDINIKNETI